MAAYTECRKLWWIIFVLNVLYGIAEFSIVTGSVCLMLTKWVNKDEIDESNMRIAMLLKYSTDLQKSRFI